MEQREFIVEAEGAGQRIDRFLSGEDTGLSRSALQALVNALNAQAGAGVFDYVKGPFTTSSGGSIAAAGDDAITVALLGRSRPVGTLIAGILFGAFKAGGFAMQAAEGVPIDIVSTGPDRVHTINKSGVLVLG